MYPQKVSPYAHAVEIRGTQRNILCYAVKEGGLICSRCAGGILVPKEVKPGGLESHPSWVGNRIKLSVFSRRKSDYLAMYPEDGDGLKVLLKHK